jgi:fluoroquinolone transport system ATP-binding protein
LTKSFSISDDEGKNGLRDIIANENIRTMHTEEATLEEIFIKVTGRELV